LISEQDLSQEQKYQSKQHSVSQVALGACTGTQLAIQSALQPEATAHEQGIKAPLVPESRIPICRSPVCRRRRL
jgi:hypothetical protein